MILMKPEMLCAVISPLMYAHPFISSCLFCIKFTLSFCTLICAPLNSLKHGKMSRGFSFLQVSIVNAVRHIILVIRKVKRDKSDAQEGFEPENEH